MRHRLEGLLQHALNRAKEGGALKLDGLPPLLFEVPKDRAFGDLATTVAERLIRKSLRDEDHRRIIEDAIGRVDRVS